MMISRYYCLMLRLLIINRMLLSHSRTHICLQKRYEQIVNLILYLNYVLKQLKIQLEKKELISDRIDLYTCLIGANVLQLVYMIRQLYSSYLINVNICK